MWWWHSENIPFGSFKIEHFSSANISAATDKGSRKRWLEFLCIFICFGSTGVRVGTGVQYVHRASAQRPGQSERLSRVLHDPAARGEVIPGVAVAVPTKTWEEEWRPLQLALTGLIPVGNWEADLRSGRCGSSAGSDTAGFVATPGLGSSDQATCGPARTWRTPRKPEHDLSKDRCEWTRWLPPSPANMCYHPRLLPDVWSSVILSSPIFTMLCENVYTSCIGNQRCRNYRAQQSFTLCFIALLVPETDGE